MVEPVDPSQRCELDLLKVPPWPLVSDHLGLVQPVDGLGQRIVVGITDAADRWRDPDLGQSICVSNRQILRAANRYGGSGRSVRPRPLPTTLAQVRPERYQSQENLTRASQQHGE